MLQIGDWFIRKDGYAGRTLRSILTIAEDPEGTKLYEVAGLGLYTVGQLYETFEPVTILERAEVEEEQCNPAA